MSPAAKWTWTNKIRDPVYVLTGGSLTLSNATVTTSVNTSSEKNSSFLGQKTGGRVNAAAVLMTARWCCLGGKPGTSPAGTCSHRNDTHEIFA
jgi:hypothetical protein